MDVENNTVVATVATSPYQDPRNIAFDGTHMWVVCKSSDAIIKIDVRTNAVVEAFNTPSGTAPYNAVFDGFYMWVDAYGTNPGQIFKYLATHR